AAAEFVADGQGGLVALFGGVVAGAVLGEDPELVVAGADPGPVAEFLADGQGGLVALFGGVVVAAILGEHPEPVVAGADPGPVAEFPADGQGGLVALFGRAVLAAEVCGFAEVLVDASRLHRGGVDTDQGCLPQF